MSSSRPRTGRRLATSVLALVLAVTISASALTPRPAQAQWIVQDIASAAAWVWEQIETAAVWAWEHGAAVAYKNALKTFLTNVAYDTAIRITSGGKGQTSLTETKSWDQSITDAWRGASGDFMDTLFTGATDHGFLNFDVCAPSSPTVQLNIGLTMFNEIQPRKPRCTLQEIKANWEAYLNRPGFLFENAGVLLDPKQNDLGIALSLQQDILGRQTQESQLAIYRRQEGDGFKPIDEQIAGGIKTPAITIQQLTGKWGDLGMGEFGQFTGDVIADALGVFTNTLAARMMKRIFDQGIVPSPSRQSSPTFGFGGAGVEYATQINSSISTVQLVGSTGAVDIISEFVNCPSSPTFYTPIKNCTITPKFAEALRRANQGSPLTLKEAIEHEQKFINGDLRFALVRTTDDASTPTKTWYLSDLRKLRMARIIPIGWELAAEKFAGQPYTLRQVMEGFSSTGNNEICDGDATESIFCGLIDPDWVLRAPPAQCRIEAYGQLLDPRGPNRQTTCVDFQHCIAEKADGTCEAWGYCKREENIWRLSGKSCEFPEGSGVSPWGTCQAYTNSTGQTSTYLANSLANFDDGVCSDAASCRWYSAARNPIAERLDDVYLPHKDATGNQANINTVDFTLATPTAPPIFYLKNVDNKKCASNQEGCTRFLQLSNINSEALNLPPETPYADQVEAAVAAVVAEDFNDYGLISSPSPVSLRQAPAYLNCYDANPENDAPECANYLRICYKNDVGCELYTPRDGSPAVPGKVEASNVCPGECAGFNTYQQTSAFFENFSLRTPPTNVEPTFNFIPQSGQKCSAAHMGCEEFTNIEQNERREYYAELRQCVRPEDNLDNTYYTWIGSDLTGYQLKTWQLKAYETPPLIPNPLAPPLTTDSSGTCELNSITNPDCKEFYATSGNDVVVHLRFESKVIYSSSLCNRYRATSVVQADCSNSGGTWEGGRCFYRAIPNQGKVCPASASGCREYRGPTAGNVRLVFPISTFGDVEPGVQADSSPLSGWVGGTNSNESTSATGHSLRTLTYSLSAKDVSGLLTTGKQYMLSLWVKGETNSQIVAGITQGSETNFFTDAPYDITTEWQILNFGPVEFTLGDTVPTHLVIGALAMQYVYLDNIAFREVQDTFFLRKNTWRTPNSCKPSTLRCAAYTTRDRQTVHLTGFSRICQASMVGCRAFVDTHNSTSPRQTIATAGNQTVITPADNVVYRVYEANKSCSAQFIGCKRLGTPNYLPSGEISTWSDVFTVLNPDTFDVGLNPSLSPLCSSDQHMCQAYTDASGVRHNFKDPGNRICEYKLVDSAVGYGWYKQGTNERCNLVTNPSFELLSSGVVDDGNADTFVDWASIPSTNPLEAVSSFNGQYWDSTVLRLPPTTSLIRSAHATIAPGAERLFAVYAHLRVPDTTTQGTYTLSLFCQAPTTCHPFGFGGNFQLVVNSDTPRNQWLLMHRVYLVVSAQPPRVQVQLQEASANGDIFVDQVQLVQILSGVDIGSYNDNELRRTALEQAALPYAYQCSSNEVGCTGYRDPELTNKTYWYLNNAALNKGLCAGQVSEKEGCLLFNEMSQPTNNWSAINTYINSRNTNNKPVAPASATAPGKCSLNAALTCTKNEDCGSFGICYIADTNLVLKVQRDRVCAEWLACQSESPRFNPQTGRFDSVCYAVGACNQLGTGDSATGRCANWVQPPLLAEPLNEEEYKKRGLDWSSQEYSGYSLPNIFPVEVLTQKEYGTAGNSDIRLTYLHPQVKTCGGFYNGESSFCASNPIGAPCVYQGNSYVCQYEDLGLASNGPGNALENTNAKLCRAYPQVDSPFPQGVVRDYGSPCVNAPGETGCPGPSSQYYLEIPKSMASGFSDAYACQDGEVCECSYSRLTYANGDNLFYGLQPAQATSAYATDVAMDGSPLLTRLRRQDTHIGLRGYCLEKDSSRLINAGNDLDQACLTWLPIDVVGGEMSVYDYSPEAGYTGGDTYYCSLAAGAYSSSALGSYNVSLGQKGCFSNCTNTWQTRNWLGVAVNINEIESITFPNNSSHPGDGGQFESWLHSAQGNTGLVFDPRANYLPCPSETSGIEAQWCWLAGTPRIYAWQNCLDEFCAGKARKNYVSFRVTVDLSASQIISISNSSRDNTPDENEHAVTNPRVRYLEACKQVVQVASGTENKAWTDRVRRNENYSIEPNVNLGFNRARPAQPFGRMSIRPSSDQWVIVGITQTGRTVTPGSQPPNLYRPFSAQIITSPYACMSIQATIGTCSLSGMGCASNSDCTTNICRFLVNTCLYGGQECTENSDCPTNNCQINSIAYSCGAGGMCIGSNDREKENQPCTFDSDCSPGGFCIGYFNDNKQIMSDPVTAGRERVRQIFAKEYRLYNWNAELVNNSFKTTWGYTTAANLDVSCGAIDGCPPGTPQIGGLGGGVPMVPTVRAVNFGTGMIPLGEGTPNNFTVIYDGAPRAGGSDVEIKTSEAITLAFYVYNANGEQMPLREVYVDWGDNTTISGALGAYKNRKFRCAVPTLPNGTTNPEYNWGDTPSACVDDSGMQKGYFTYTHVYANPGSFTPRIFVADNWEWCAVGGWRCNPHGRGDALFRSTGLGWIAYNGTIIVSPPPGGVGTYVAGPMTISPIPAVNSCGRQGGPFTPPGRTYTVTNSGTATMGWTASSSQPWLTLTPTSGAIGPGGSTAVNAVLNSQANGLSPNNYTATISLINTTNNTPPGPVIRTFNLQVVSPTAICGVASQSDY